MLQLRLLGDPSSGPLVASATSRSLCCAKSVHGKWKRGYKKAGGRGFESPRVHSISPRRESEVCLDLPGLSPCPGLVWFFEIEQVIGEFEAGAVHQGGIARLSQELSSERNCIVLPNPLPLVYCPGSSSERLELHSNHCRHAFASGHASSGIPLYFQNVISHGCRDLVYP